MRRRRQHLEAGRERAAAGAARDAQERHAAEDPGREEHLALEEAQAKLKQLQQTYDLKRAGRARPTSASSRSAAIAPQNAMQQAASNAERMLIKSPIDGHRRDQVDLEGRQHGRDPGGRRGPLRRPGRRRRQSGDDEGAGEGEPGGHRRAARRPGGARRARRLSGPVVHRHGRPDLADRRAVDAVAEGAQLHRAGRRRRRAPEPDAGPDRVARRRAVARGRRARRAARRRRATTARRRSCRCSAAGRSSGSDVAVGGDEHARDRRHRRGSTEGNVIARNIGPGQVDDRRRCVRPRVAIPIAAVGDRR